jgi:hypothetical protein
MVPAHLIATLGSAAYRALQPVLSTGAIGQTRPSREEDFVAAFVLGAMPLIATAWSALLQPLGLSLTVRAIYCHGRPQVAFSRTGLVANVPPSGSCELADLLLCIDDTSGNLTTRRAALVQAKMLKGGTVSLSGSDLVQLDLLQNWPAFTFQDPGYATRARDFTAGVSAAIATDSAAYGLIDKGASLPTWEQLAPARKLSPPGQDLGAYFAGLADSSAAATGRAAVVGASDDWSYTIDELLSFTGGKPLNLASVPPGWSRGVRHLVRFYALADPRTSFVFGFDYTDAPNPPDAPTVGDERRREQGLSYVHVKIGTADGREGAR